MKKLVCEMCGSTDLIKEDGVFVCQYCGCKYSVEEAKKMMIEGTVEIQGTVTVDNSESVEKHLTNARRAYEKKDWEKTEQYYNLVEQNDPSNNEAFFYSAFAKTRLAIQDEDYSKRTSAMGVLCRCVDIITNKYEASEKDLLEKIGKDLLEMFNSVNEPYKIFGDVSKGFVQSFIKIAETYPEDDIDNRKFFYKIATDLGDVSCEYEYILKVKKYLDPDITIARVIINNRLKGIIGDWNYYLTIPGLYEHRSIPKGESIVELMPGEYECILYSGDETFKKKQEMGRISIPQHSKINLINKTKGGLTMEIV